LYLQEELQSELNFEKIVGVSASNPKTFSRVLKCGAHRLHGAAAGRNRTGKELIGARIAQSQPPQQSGMVKVNCAALPPSLVESELFGHEKGAFTAPVAQKKAALRSPIAAPSSWTKPAKPAAWKRRPSCCAVLQSRNSKGWADRKPRR